MLKKAGAEACRPDEIEGTFGLKGRTYNLSEIQAQAILDMRLQRLTGLEVEKVVEEYKELIKHISHLKGILESKPQRMDIIKKELLTIKDQYADERRTEIVPI